MATLAQCAKALRGTLAPAGFSLKSSTWRRNMGDFIDIIHFERDKLGMPAFTVGVGVLTKSAFEKAWGEQVSVFPRAMECTVHDDLMRLSSERMSWWDMNEASLMEVTELVRKVALPFLEEMHSRERQIRYLRERKIAREWIMPLYEAILMHECGEREEACLKLRNFKAKYSEIIEKRASEIAARLNCPKL